MSEIQSTAPHRSTRLLAVLVLLANALVARAALAQGAEDAASTCRPGNLLHGLNPSGEGGAARGVQQLTDDVVAPEGATWPAPDVLVAARGPLVYDLGRLETVRRIFLQVDADQSFDIELSRDGARWARLPVEAHPTASGMLSRTVDLPAIPTRLLRLSTRHPSRMLALTEVRVSCREDDATKGLRVASGVHESAIAGWMPTVWSWLTGSPVVMRTDVGTSKMIVVVLALILVWIGWRRRTDAPAPRPRWQHTLHGLALASLAVASMATYYELGAYHSPKFVHVHDVFHYFVGAKYFPELGYDELYECAAVAEAEAGFAQRVSQSSHRDLRNNVLIGGDAVLRRAKECTDRFSPERWAAFSSDVQYFASLLTVREWIDMTRDHGFNASPTWIAIGRAVAARHSAADGSIGVERMFSGVVTALDPLLLCGAAFALVWAFGARTAALAIIVFGCSALSQFLWVGGSFLRQLWLAALVLGLCLSRRGRPALAGAFLALSALLQLFPAACLGAVALLAGLEWWRTRTLAREARRMLAGAALTVALVAPLSAFATGRSAAWSEFAANTEKHASTPAGNLVGLRSALSYRTETRAALVFDASAEDPFAPVRAARQQNYLRARPLHWLGILAGLALLVRCLWLRPPFWQAATLGLALVPLTLETSCYYASWVAVLALAAHGRRASFSVLLLVVLGELVTPLLSTEADVPYAIASWLLVAGALAFLVVMAGFRGAYPPPAAR